MGWTAGQLISSVSGVEYITSSYDFAHEKAFVSLGNIYVSHAAIVYIMLGIKSIPRYSRKVARMGNHQS